MSEWFMSRFSGGSWWRERAVFAVLAAACFAVPAQSRAQTAPPTLQMLADLTPLSQQAMSTVSGMGLIIVQQPTRSPASAAIVLWDELRRGPLNTSKSFPGVSVTVNGVPQ